MTLLNSRVIRIAERQRPRRDIDRTASGGAFRYFLDHLRHPAQQLDRPGASGDLRLVGCFRLLSGLAGACLARLLVVKFAPTAEGSGVQRVEAVFSGRSSLLRASVVPVKFFGGLLAMGCGLALGREGPTVQMGASFGSWVSRFLLKEDEDRRVVDAASAGAGLAVAFNAPIGGSIFVFEELTSNFTPWLLVSTLAAATVAVWLMRYDAGQHA